jgi:hypothetical protein
MSVVHDIVVSEPSAFHLVDEEETELTLDEKKREGPEQARTRVSHPLFHGRKPSEDYIRWCTTS